MQTPYSIAKPDSAIVAAAEILGKEIHHINVFAQGVIDREDTSPLHDLRVSIRKLRAAIRLFSPFLQDTYAAHLDNKFAVLSDDLSPARDFDAWLEYLQSSDIRQQLGGTAQYEAYISRLIEERREHLPAICFLLESSYSGAFRDEVREFSEQQLPALVANNASPEFRLFGGQRLYRHYRKVRNLDKLNPNSAVDRIHEVRKKCRWGRYWAEFIANVAEPPTELLAKHFKGIATALGTARDMHLHVVQLDNNEFELPGELVEWHQTMEQKAWEKYARVWQRLTDKSFKRQLKQDLVKRGKP